MTSQNTQGANIPNFRNSAISKFFRNSAILNGFFAIIEYSLILITIFVYVSNIALLIACIIIISGLIYVLGYSIILKNPYYYISCLGLIFLTVFPSSISMILFISFTKWSYEPVKFFIIISLVIEYFYITFLIMEVRHNKYTSYFHRKYGNLRQTVLKASFYSVKEFDKLDKGRKFWQDQNPEEVQKKKEELRAYEKKFKKKFLMRVQILAILGFIIIFGISQMY